jgi:trehalose-phosphatase
MKILNPEKDPSKFFGHLKKSQNRALLLDYDGTLAPFTVNRDKAFPYPGVEKILKYIIQDGSTRLVIITGRGVHDLIPLLGLEQLPEIWGSHGAERLMPDGPHHKAAVSNGTARGVEAATQWMVNMGWSDHLERKPFGVALHWRGMKAAKIDEIRDRLLENLPHLTAGNGLSLHEFDGGLELRPSEITKGEAVETILAEMQGDTVSAYLGDDFTDEDAFVAVKGHSTHGIGVLVRGELRETKADLWLRPVEELLDFLIRWHKGTS